VQHQSAESRKSWLRFGIGDEESRPDVVNLSTNTSVRFCSVRSHRGMLAAMTGAEVRDDVAEVRMAIDDALPVEARVQLKNPRLNESTVPMENCRPAGPTASLKQCGRWCRRMLVPPCWHLRHRPSGRHVLTNRIIGGVAPSEYLAKLEAGNSTTPALERHRLDAYLRSHLIDPELLRHDKFETFLADRQKRLFGLIEQGTGKAAYTGEVTEEGIDVEVEENGLEAGMTIAA